MSTYTITLNKRNLLGQFIAVKVMADEVYSSSCNGGFLEFKKKVADKEGEAFWLDEVAVFNRGEWLYYVKSDQ